MKLLSIFVGKPREVEYQDKIITTSIFKEPIEGPVQVIKHNIVGDEQADLKVHGGEEKAVYAFPIEHYEFWKEKKKNHQFYPGVFGENLSITGLLEDDVCVGDRLRIGSTILEVTVPRMPCFKLGIKMNDPMMVRDFFIAQKPGFYLKVIREGQIEIGDSIEKIGNDGHRLTVMELTRLYTSDGDNEDLLRKATLSPSLISRRKKEFQQKLESL